MKARLFAFALMAGLTGLVSVEACATPEYALGRCAETEDCFTEINKQPDGSVCLNAGVCSCPSGAVACCRDGEPGECIAELDCAPEDRCPPPPVECEQDSECPQPPDAECGRGFCESGQCKIDIHPGPIASQRYGDCKRRECTMSGALIELDDVGDFYDDANGCTQDMCMEGAPVNAPLANGITCPALGAGYCHDGSCVQCIASMPAAASCGAGLVCDSKFWCVPTGQCSGICGGICAPCGIGYPCNVDSDCLYGNCVAGKCDVPNCSNGKTDGEETDIDCGSCAPCGDGKACTAADHCSSGVCKGGKCQAPTCLDGVQNGGELGTDCGGPCGPC